MRTLNRKLLRDLWHIKGQAISISLVIAAGVAVYVLMLSTLESLELTRAVYYERYRFADVFASAKRAPLSLREEIEQMPGVSTVETRVVVDVTVDLDGYKEPVVGRLISVPGDRPPELCDISIQKGRYLDPGRQDEALVSANFAEAHGLEPGDFVAVVMNGRRKRLEIAGLALSPEYVYNIRPGEMMPDDKRFAIFWVEQRSLAAAYQMEGGFNNVLLKLGRGASEADVLERLDHLLERYGGLGAIPRRLQISHWFLENELQQLRTFGSVIPMIFLGVAAFLLNVVLARMISVQREQIGALKALGYTNVTIASHYLKFALFVALIGSFAGVVVGVRLGRGMTEMYNQFFHFPELIHRLGPAVLIRAAGVSVVVAVVGALTAVRRVVRLPAAEAMRPEPPASYRKSWIERLGLQRLMSQPARIVLRSLERRPWRAVISIAGIAAATALLIIGTFSGDAILDLTEFQFSQAQRYDMMVAFIEPASPRALHELSRLPGVLDLEPFRSVPVRLIHGYRQRDLVITGVPVSPRLNRVMSADTGLIELPPSGLAISSALADSLAIRAGDTVVLDVREGRQPRLTAVVTQLIDDYLGVNAYMDLSALRRLMQEDQTLSGAYLRVDPLSEERLFHQLKNTPAVAAVSKKSAAIESFNETFAEMMGTMRAIYTVFAGLIALGVVYNSARISLAERTRELGTLRVIGFSQREVSFILLGELTVITAAAIPAGIVLGKLAVVGLAEAVSSEAFRLPGVVSARTLILAAGTIAGAAFLSAVAVKRNLQRLDLVESLKLRE